MRPGSVVVDMAAEMGGNIATTKPGEVYTYKWVLALDLLRVSECSHIGGYLCCEGSA